MLQIDFSPTFKKIQNFAQEYNQQFIMAKEASSKQKSVGAADQLNDIKKMLRTSHITLMKRLVECLSSQINKHQALHGPLDYSIQEDDLPELMTNNVCLGKSLGCTSKTIYNQLKRLETAGFISGRTYRGSRSDYKIKLKSSLLQLILNGNPVLIPDVKNSVENAPAVAPSRAESRKNLTQGRGFAAEGKKKIHHTGKIKIIERNNNNISGVIVDKSSITGLLNAFKGTTINQENLASNENFSEKNPEKSGPVRRHEEKTPPPVAAPPPKSANLSPEAKQYGQLLMNFMFATVFSKMPYHAPKQLQACRDFIIREFEDLEGRELKAKFKEIRLRLLLAWEYVQRDPANRYIPNSPIKYFDPENKSGYAGTRFWYDKFRDNKRKIKESNELINEYMARWDWMNKAIDMYLENPNTQGYFKTKRIILAKYPEIANAFDNLVLNQNKLTA